MHKQKGNIAETAVIHYLTKLGLPVFKEIGDSVAIDLITIVNKRAVTIQVKYAELNDSGSVSLLLRKTGPGGYVYYYQMGDFDLFALYVADVNKIVWISAKEALFNTTTIQFRSIPTRNNQSVNVRMIDDYTDFYKALLP